MNPKKSGTIFIVLMIGLIAYGFGSVANAMDLDGNTIVNAIPSNFNSFNQQQITPINDPSFKPVYLINHIVINKTNTTNTTNNDNNLTSNMNQNTNQ